MATESPAERKKRAEEIAQLLAKEHPYPVTELNHNDEYELFVAVVLSAMTTDKKVNQVTPGLFARFGNWEALAAADLAELRGLIRQVNFHKGKAVRLIKAAEVVLSEFGGALPRDIAGLTKIPGVARKSANVIMQEVWNVAEGIVVDTHVTRVSGRLGLTGERDAVKIERDLMAVVPKKFWRNFSGAVVLHGRYICVARKPKCGECVLNQGCPSAFKV